MDLITAIITTHKREPYIVERAIKSILSQTYREIEIIVVDDSPQEYECRHQVKEAAERLGAQYIAHETCQGACAARNTGLAAAKGKYVAFLDDDDEWLPEKIEKQKKCFVHEDIALVYCGNKIINESNGMVTDRKMAWHSGKVYDSLILENYIGSTSFPLLRTSALRAVGGFDPLMQSSQDYDVWLRLSEKYEVSYVREPLAIYHIHEGDQITRNYAKKINGLERLNQKNAEYLQSHKTARWIREIKIAPMYAGDRQLGKALKKWMLAAALRPLNVKENTFYFVSLCSCFLSAR